MTSKLTILSIDPETPVRTSGGCRKPSACWSSCGSC